MHGQNINVPVCVCLCVCPSHFLSTRLQVRPSLYYKPSRRASHFVQTNIVKHTNPTFE